MVTKAKNITLPILVIRIWPLKSPCLQLLKGQYKSKFQILHVPEKNSISTTRGYNSVNNNGMIIRHEVWPLTASFPANKKKIVNISNGLELMFRTKNSIAKNKRLKFLNNYGRVMFSNSIHFYILVIICLKLLKSLKM